MARKCNVYTAGSPQWKQRIMERNARPESGRSLFLFPDDLLPLLYRPTHILGCCSLSKDCQYVKCWNCEWPKENYTLLCWASLFGFMTVWTFRVHRSLILLQHVSAFTPSSLKHQASCICILVKCKLLHWSGTLHKRAGRMRAAGLALCEIQQINIKIALGLQINSSWFRKLVCFF